MQDFCFNPGFLARWRTFFPEADIWESPTAGHYLFMDEIGDCIQQIDLFLKKEETASP